MSSQDMLRDSDLLQIAEQGITVEEVQRQIRLFEHPPPCPLLERACTIGDGVRTLSAAELNAATADYETASRMGRLMKFVPASGAASRMFHSLLAARESGSSEALQPFIAALRQFAFFEDLQVAVAAAGLDLGALIAAGNIGVIVDSLLGPSGLDYAALPKGLLKFHRYADGSRTPFEEHLVEAAGLIREASGTCRLHFTVSPEHEDRFRRRLDEVRSTYERRWKMELEVGFSVQKPSTDTLAVDLENRPFRTADDHLLFRPGGHGALIENLHDLGGDVILIKNIDNVVPDRLRGPTLQWKKALAGVLVTLQRAIFGHLKRLLQEAGPTVVQEALGFARAHLSLDFAAPFDAAKTDELRAALVRKLDRPLRVCGVVRNTGEPGGGPFWVRGRDGSLSLQIIEQAQVDPRSPAQQAIFQASTHFNPVDLVCAVRDHSGAAFDLHRYVDPEAVFIAEKSKDGRHLKALERPGLWNGAMADWTTIFIEVPVSTFTPVKTVFDLLRPEHQAEEDLVIP